MYRSTPFILTSMAYAITSFLDNPSKYGIFYFRTRIKENVMENIRIGTLVNGFDAIRIIAQIKQY